MAEKNKNAKVSFFLITTYHTGPPILTRLDQVIEYSLFQPGWFLNYLAGYRKIATHVQPTGFTVVDYEQGVARVAGSLDNKVTYTAIRDLVNIVVKAIDYEGEWPTIGGINGNTLTLAEEIAIGERVRGKCQYSDRTRGDRSDS